MKRTSERNILGEKFQITEGVEGLWRYHISTKGKHSKSLCGQPTMITNMTFDGWGIKTDVNERYCDECWKLAQMESNNETNI